MTPMMDTFRCVPKKSVIRLLRSDIERRGVRVSFRSIVACLLHPGFRAGLFYRLSHSAINHRIPVIPELLMSCGLSHTGAEIRPEAVIGPGLLIQHPGGIVIGAGVLIGERCTILQNVTIGEAYSHLGGHDYPRLGDNITVCAGAVVLGAVVIKDNVVIGANSVVLSDVPSDTTVAGAPARAVRSLQTRK